MDMIYFITLENLLKIFFMQMHMMYIKKINLLVREPKTLSILGFS